MILDTRDLAAEMDSLDSLDHLGGEEWERLCALRDLRDEIGDEFEDGVTLIPVDEFEDYARELAEDTGMVSDDFSWPYTCIDWAAAAVDLSADYTHVSFDGTDYYYRVG